jgi:hypothetical protein
MNCATCLHWIAIGTTPTPRRMMRDLGVKIIPAGTEGECHAGPPATDHAWPVTHEGDSCGQYASLRAALEKGGRHGRAEDVGERKTLGERVQETFEAGERVAAPVAQVLAYDAAAAPSTAPATRPASDKSPRNPKTRTP